MKKGLNGNKTNVYRKVKNAYANILGHLGQLRLQKFR